MSLLVFVPARIQNVSCGNRKGTSCMIQWLFRLLRNRKPISSRLDALCRPLHYQKCLSDKRYAGVPVGLEAVHFIDDADLAPADVLICPGDGSDGTWSLISHGSSGDYVHAAIYVGDGVVVEAVQEGVRRTTLTELLNRYPYVAVSRCPGASSDAMPGLAEKVVDFCLKHADAKTPYNLGGAVMAPIRELKELRYENRTHRPYLPRPLKRPKTSFFCSELVFEAFIHGGYIREGEMEAASRSPTALAEDSAFCHIGYLGNRELADHIWEQDHFMTGGIPRIER